MISYFLPHPGKKTGGIDVVAHNLAQGLAFRKHEMTVYSNADYESLQKHYTVKRLPFAKLLNNYWGVRFCMGYLGHFLNLLIEVRSADAVIAHGESLFLPLKGVPVLRIFHGSALGEALHAQTPWRMLHQAGVYLTELAASLLYPESCVAVSQNTRRYYPWINNVICNGVDLSAFWPDATSKTRNPSILFVGTLEGRKRGKLLLEWHQKVVLPVFPETKLHMVCPPGPSLRQVVYHEGIVEHELAELYRRCWVYASPSDYEGFGLPYVEAMASGTPVLATPNPGSREILAENEYGILADDNSFPKELLNLLSGQDLRKHYTEKGKQRSRQYSLEAMVEAYERVIQSLVG